MTDGVATTNGVTVACGDTVATGVVETTAVAEVVGVSRTSVATGTMVVAVGSDPARRAKFDDVGAGVEIRGLASMVTVAVATAGGAGVTDTPTIGATVGDMASAVVSPTVNVGVCMTCPIAP